MRTLVRAVLILVALPCVALANETAIDKRDTLLAQAEGEVPEVYALKWQRQLLVVQLAFAATLADTDPLETGSINPQAQ